MANKFTGLDDAANLLGVSKDKLNELREAGRLRAYRDGASWKFRTEDVEKLQADPSELNVAESGIDLEEYSPDAGLSSLSIDSDGDEPKTGESPASDLDLDMLDEPTVPVDADPAEVEPSEAASSDIQLGEEIALDDSNESILLSEEELGDSLERPPSTIIGRSQLQEEVSDDDLQIAAEPDAHGAGASDVRLADDHDDALDDLITGDKPAAGMFDDLEELEIDLEAESSRILEAQDVAAAQEAAQKMASASDDDLKLEESGLKLAGESASPSSVELAADEADDLELDLAGSGVELQADGSDDMVLDADDDDFSLSSADSGINLRPSDSGLALDDDSFALGGSAVGSSLDLGDSLAGDSFAVGEQSEVSLEGSTAFASSPDFNLQPSSDEDDEEEEDSSQIIALDAIEDGVEDDDDADVIIGDAAAPAVGMAHTPVMAPEAAFPIWIVAFLFLSTLLMSVTAIMATDIVRSMWAWEEPFALGSPLIEGFLGLIGMDS